MGKMSSHFINCCKCHSRNCRPPYSPELNPVERVWLYLRERFLSLRVLDDTEAIIDTCCQAWIDLIAEPDRMRTLCAYPWIMKVIS